MPNAQAVYAGRNVRLYDAPWADDLDLPANTVAWGTAWGAPWGERGYTQEGVTTTMTIDREEIDVDQVLDPVLMPASGRNISMATNLAEFTGDNLLRGLGQGTVDTTAPGVSTRGYTDFILDATIGEDFRGWGMDFQKPYDGEAIRQIGYRGMAVGDVEYTAGQVDDNLKVPLEVRFLPDDSVSPARIFLVRDMIPATGP